MVTVVGLGFVGLTTALGFADHGIKVYGLEAMPERLSTIQGGKLPFMEPGLDEALPRNLGKNFIPTDDWDLAIANSECVYYCVGTPYGEDGQADLTYLFGAMDQTLAAIHDGKPRVMVVKSTVPPSTCEKRVIPFLAERGVKVPEQMGVANNPEFLREGHCWDDFTQPDRIVLGVSDERSEAMLRKLYAWTDAPVIAVNLNTGEYIKYLSNTSLACLISFSNEMSLAADAIGGIDVAKAFRVLHMDKRWQTGTIRAYCYPGCGYGGYCLPKDTNAFYAVAKGVGFDGQILKNVIDTNDAMPEATAKRIIRAAGEDKDVCIGILGLSFNVGSDDVRDAPSGRIIRALNEAGYKNIVAYDPVAMEGFQRFYKLDYHCAAGYEDVVREADMFAITTAWPMFGDIKEKTDKPVVDCRYML